MVLIVVLLLGPSPYGQVGVGYMSLSHGLVSSILFLIFGLLYAYSGSRFLLFKSGYFVFSSIFLFLFMLVVLMKFSFPPSLGFFSEIIMLRSSNLNCYLRRVLVLVFSLFLIGVYKIWFYCCLVDTRGSVPLTKLRDLLITPNLLGLILVLLVINVI